MEITRKIIIFIIFLLFKGSCFKSESYVAGCDMEQSWVLKAVDGQIYRPGLFDVRCCWELDSVMGIVSAL